MVAGLLWITGSVDITIVLGMVIAGVGTILALAACSRDYVPTKRE